MMRFIHLLIASLVALLVLGGCATTASHPSLTDANLPKLIPVRQFVANVDYNSGYRISPDGKKIAWNGVSRLQDAILWRNLDSKATSALRFAKSSPGLIWAADSQHLLYHEDPSGRENYHVYAVDTADPKLIRRNLTPYPGVKAFIARVPASVSDFIYIFHNRRDASVFDLYSINLVSGEESLLFENNENTIQTLVDDDGNIRARVRQTDNARVLEVPASFLSSKWKTLITAGRFDSIKPVDLSDDGSHLYLLSNVARDKRALSKINLETGVEQTLLSHNDVDIDYIFMSQRDRRPLLAYATPDYPELIFLDEKLEQRLARFRPADRPAGLNIMSIDRQERHATISNWDASGASYHLIDLVSGQSELLGEGSSRKLSASLVENKPISLSASDGMQLHGYLSLPKIKNTSSLPTVLLVHGGPWARDWWGYKTAVQFYANRGYAVLQINYRGSNGYGRAYMDAAVGEFAGKMHQDLVDAVDWAIDEGIADPKRIAIVGGSYGGYATLVGMTMTPGKFACGIDNVGVSDLATLIESAPPYWKPWLPLWHKFVGDPADAQQRKIMDAKSPLNYASQMLGPLLVFHGANDPRVNIDQSDRMVSNLKAAGKDVNYIVIKGEGHGFDHWKNQLDYYRKAEDFLAQCLGGRSSGFDFYQLGSWAF